MTIFDSLALPYDDPNVKLLVDSVQKEYDVSYTKLNPAAVQSENSLSCGFYAIAYVLSQSKNQESPQDFINLFHKSF